MSLIAGSKLIYVNHQNEIRETTRRLPEGTVKCLVRRNGGDLGTRDEASIDIDACIARKEWEFGRVLDLGLYKDQFPSIFLSMQDIHTLR